MKLTTTLFAAATALTMMAGPLAAQQYPSKQITIVVPFPAGGQQDIEARALADSMSKRMNQAVIVENKPGAGAAIGIGHVAKAAPDGYTILVTGAGAALLHLVRKDLGFDNTKDIVPVSLLSNGTSLIVTDKKTGAKNWEEFMAKARKEPGKLNYASLGVSSVSLAMAGLKSAAGDLPITEIPYKGMSEYVTAMLAGDVQLILGTIGGFKPHIDKGDFIPLLQVAEKRYPAFPNVPTTAEKGYGSKIRPFAWTGVFVPKGTPQAVIDKLYQEIAFYVKQPETKKRAENFFTDLVGSSPAEFKKVYDADIAAWGAVAKSINLQPQ